MGEMSGHRRRRLSEKTEGDALAAGHLGGGGEEGGAKQQQGGGKDEHLLVGDAADAWHASGSAQRQNAIHV